MNQPVSALYDFIDSAVKSRKYPESTAQTLRAAIRLYEQELNDTEKSSITEFHKNIEQIASAVFTKYKLKFSVGSLATYKSRVLKVINDYSRYGTDAAKMANWNPKVIVRSKKSVKRDDSTEEINLPQNAAILSPISTAPTTTYTKDFGEGRVAQLSIPSDISDEERDKLALLIKSM